MNNEKQEQNINDIGTFVKNELKHDKTNETEFNAA